MTVLSSRWRGARRHLEALRKDTGGAAILIFAVAAMVLALVATGAIEYNHRNRVMTAMQNAVDSAALAAKKQETLYKKTMGSTAARTKGEKAGKDIFDRIVADSKQFSGTKPSVTFKWSGSALTASTTGNFDMFFGAILPANFKNVAAAATVDFSSSLPTEVALVLDTTASMFNKDGRSDTRFTLMRNAAKNFTHQLFNASQTANDASLVRISVVPWATSVNVKGAAPAANDFNGDATVSSIADKGSQIPVSSPISRSGRVTVNNNDFRPVDWRGCISGATEPAAYTDGGGMNWNALLVPAAPQVLLKMYEGPLASTPVTSCTCTSSQNVPCTGGGGGGTQGFNRLLERAVPQISNAAMFMDRSLRRAGSPEVDKAQCSTCLSQSCTTTNQMLPSCPNVAVRQVPYCSYYGAGGVRNSYIPDTMACTTQWEGCYETGKSPTASETASACVADPNEPKAINGSVTWCPAYYSADSKNWSGLTSTNSIPEIAGPNLNCPAPMLGLSGNRKQVLEYLDRMHPVPGGTHADVGLRWGLRTLSDSNGWPSFFGVTTKPTAFKSASQKVMVMITDGANEQAIDFPGYWGCSNTGNPGCTTSPDQATLDAKMQSWCDAIRTTYGVTIYAVAVNFTDTANVDKLKTCAGNPANVFSVDAASLNTVLDGIAARVMSLRLTN